MTIREIERITFAEAQNMAIATTEIKEHDCFFVELGEHFGYSVLIFKNGRHIYHANDYELHNSHIVTKKGKEALKRYYIKSLSKKLFTNAELLGEACIGDSSCYITIKGLGKNYENTTVFTTKNKNIAVKDNDYYYKTLSEFANQMEEIFGDSKYAKEYLALVELAKIHFGIEK